jgi:hypothetical protein
MDMLQFRENGTFTIVQFTDIHWKNGGPEDEASYALMKQVIQRETPDLVVFTGDVIHSEACRDPLASYGSAVRAATEAGVKWAAVFGNHDADSPHVTKEQLIALQQNLPGCVTEAGPQLDDRLGNTCIEIAASGGGQAKAALYLLDSGGDTDHPVGGYQWITHSQIGWYKEQAGRLLLENGGEPVPALAFFHIPLPEYNELWDYHTCYGVNYEGMGCAKVNSGLFAAFLETGDVRGTFTGHDHINDFWGKLHGIRLHYGRGTGCGAYGREGMLRGARVIRLNEAAPAAFTTWLRLEDGSVVEAQPVHKPEKVWKRV